MYTSKKKFLITITVLLILTSFVFVAVKYEKWAINQLFSWKNPRQEAAERVKGVHIEDLNGFIIWSTNRYGNHELVKMTLPDKNIIRFTNNPQANTFPRISPDGNQVVFNRAQKTNVSQRDYLSWDIYLLDMHSGTEILLVENGYAPSWSEKGNAIYFQRKGVSVWKYDFATTHETVVFESGKSAHTPEGVTFGMPSWSDKSLAMAVTLRDGLYGTGIIKTGGDVLQLGGGCQIQWSPDGSWLYYVDHDLKMNNVFYRIDFKTRKKVLLFDSPTLYSHEYFPKLDKSGKYLVYGASTGGHELDQADYEIFLWRVGSPFDSAVRLTNDPANDCWPDIYLINTVDK
jgi:Tol biopolymer transport system component